MYETEWLVTDIMMKEKMMTKGICGLVMSTCFVFSAAMTSFAGSWQKMNNQWFYLDDAGQSVRNQMIVDNNQMYYLDENGVMQTGFVPLNGAYYHFGPAGNLQTGWVYDQDAWYYMQQDAAHFGQMIVDKIETINDRMYYFGTDGKMAHDTITHQMFFGSDGGAVTYDMLKQMTSEDYAKARPLTTSEGGSTSAAVYDHDAYVEEVFELVNKERERKNRDALELDPDLCDYADERAEEIVSDFSHDGFYEGAEDILGDGARGENIAMGYKTPTAVVDGWKNSKGHYHNMMIKTYTRTGIGIYNANGILYWVQVFAE